MHLVQKLCGSKVVLEFGKVDEGVMKDDQLFLVQRFGIQGWLKAMVHGRPFGLYIQHFEWKSWKLPKEVGFLPLHPADLFS